MSKIEYRHVLTLTVELTSPTQLQMLELTDKAKPVLEDEGFTRYMAVSLMVDPIIT